MEERTRIKTKRGFALWPKDKLRAAQSRGGKGVLAEARTFSDVEVARRAGRAGAKARWGTSFNKESGDEGHDVG